MVSNAGGKMLYEEQTNVTKDGWQQFLPAWYHARLSSQPEVESTSPPLEFGPACDLLLPMAYSRSDYASPRPSLKKPSSFWFRSLGSQWPCCREGLAGTQGEDRPPVEEHRGAPPSLQLNAVMWVTPSETAWSRPSYMWSPPHTTELWVAFIVVWSHGNIALRHDEDTQGDNRGCVGSADKDEEECQRREFSSVERKGSFENLKYIDLALNFSYKASRGQMRRWTWYPLKGLSLKIP